jgi:hypothetical protein
MSSTPTEITRSAIERATENPRAIYHRLCGTSHIPHTACPRNDTFRKNIKLREQSRGESHNPQSRPRRKNNKETPKNNKTKPSRLRQSSVQTGEPQLATSPEAFYSVSNTRERFNRVLARIQNAINENRREIGQPPAYFARDLSITVNQESATELQEDISSIMQHFNALPPSEANILNNDEANLIILALIFRREPLTIDRLMLYIRRIRSFVSTFY